MKKMTTDQIELDLGLPFPGLPARDRIAESEGDEIAQTIKLCAAQPHNAPASPVGKNTIDFLELVQRNGAPGQILVADVSGVLAEKAPYFVLGEQPFKLKVWEHYCSSGLHNIVKLHCYGCLRRIETLAAETVSHVMVDLDTTKSCPDSVPGEETRGAAGWRQPWRSGWWRCGGCWNADTRRPLLRTASMYISSRHALC